MTTLIKPELEADVEGLGAVHRVIAPFDQAHASLKDSGMNYPITARDLAYARIKEGASSSLSRYGGYTREGLIYTPNKPVLFLSHSPLLTKTNTEKATQAHKNGAEFYLDAEKYHNQAEEDNEKQPDKRRAFTLDKKQNYDIPTNRFNQDELTLFLFKNQAENYGNFLRENGINGMPVWLVDKEDVNKQDSSFIRQLWLSNLDNGSVLNGYGWNLDCNSRVRGVLKKTGEAGRARERHFNGKIKLPYTGKQIDRELKRLSRLEEEIKKSREFIESLRQ